MPPDGVRTHDLSWRAAVDLHLRPRGHGDRDAKQLEAYYVCWISSNNDITKIHKVGVQKKNYYTCCRY